MTSWEWRSYKDTVRRYFKFVPEEIRALIITILVIGFIVGLNDGSEQFKIGSWLMNFFIMLLIVATAVLVQQTGHRLFGIAVGFKVEYKLWWNGLIIGLVVALLSKGNVWVLLPGGIFVHHMAIHRLGWYRYGLNIRAIGLTALMGPVFNILFAGIAKSIALWFPFLPFTAVLNKIFFFNLVFAAYNMIPIPPLAGSRLLYFSRIGYAFVFGSIGGYALLAWFGIYSYVYAILIGFVVYVLFFAFYEKEAWNPLEVEW